MFQISLFKVGLVAMLFFVMASNVMNYVSIGVNTWDTNPFAGLWGGCVKQPNLVRERCFKENPPALIATGTALNCLSFLLIIVSQLAIFSIKFKDSFAMYFVIGSVLTSLLSLVFSSIGWFFVFHPQYQEVQFALGWGFWLMTGSFASTIIASVIGSSILGCTCVTNEYERRRITQSKTNVIPVFIPQDPNDPQVLRL
ncbi:unnamed protein product [Brachionus calyciflorus]|uniref:Uncharacterized protein n=1 Tax=Brachionus calyciflorus TaxID=104777 RepID=A0A814JR42_9BILA|nr:unnamed protein product [Brachionus calyciflorus]